MQDKATAGDELKKSLRRAKITIIEDRLKAAESAISWLRWTVAGLVLASTLYGLSLIFFPGG